MGLERQKRAFGGSDVEKHNDTDLQWCQMEKHATFTTSFCYGWLLSDFLSTDQCCKRHLDLICMLLSESLYYFFLIFFYVISLMVDLWLMDSSSSSSFLRWKSLSVIPLIFLRTSCNDG